MTPPSAKAFVLCLLCTALISLGIPLPLTHRILGPTEYLFLSVSRSASDLPYALQPCTSGEQALEKASSAYNERPSACGRQPLSRLGIRLGHGLFAVSQADEASSALPSHEGRLCRRDTAKDTQD
ncbi:uncharacterized protein SCHCODRAFT_02187334 [Schizophyllum commune H4-8]|uniref:uncharacterized protein n=1 Tax=Schizophyllum commune (strain H4-8 / FGSC 9210) TaxID=578458 RepID=UPI00216027F1|nr:uncharacterized protein SCHCODRAFT_02187334 [Schizophyllum commune H4-8]KAI5896272.1 hypothetical protein SCHCODRAFT_02187334 [Schizophyllum commune H4-8]